MNGFRFVSGKWKTHKLKALTFYIFSILLSFDLFQSFTSQQLIFRAYQRVNQFQPVLLTCELSVTGNATWWICGMYSCLWKHVTHKSKSIVVQEHWETLWNNMNNQGERQLNVVIKACNIWNDFYFMKSIHHAYKNKMVQHQKRITFMTSAIVTEDWNFISG